MGNQAGESGEMSDVYNELPELTRAEKQALLDRAVELTLAARGGPLTHDEQQRFDASVDLQFTMSSFMLVQGLAAQTRQREDEAALDAG